MLIQIVNFYSFLSNCGSFTIHSVQFQSEIYVSKQPASQQTTTCHASNVKGRGNSIINYFGVILCVICWNKVVNGLLLQGGSYYFLVCKRSFLFLLLGFFVFTPICLQHSVVLFWFDSERGPKMLFNKLN